MDFAFVFAIRVWKYDVRNCVLRGNARTKIEGHHFSSVLRFEDDKTCLAPQRLLAKV
jgi:hypothetical protein